MRSKKNKINKLAIKTKSIQRIPNKLLSDKLVEAFCECSVQTEFSLQNICAHLFEKYNIEISKQGLAKRINKHGTIELLKEIVATIFIKSINYETNEFKFLQDMYHRVIIQDSTILHLPKHLYKLFSGSKKGSRTTANARIQFSYDILNKNFVNFTIDRFSKNDLASAPEIEVTQGDLWMRDRGYFNLDACYKIQDDCGDFIMRYKAYTHLYFLDGRPFNIMKELKNIKSINIEVLVGDCKIPMNLVVMKANNQIADERRRKANLKYRFSAKGKKKGNDKNKNIKRMTKEYSFLCGYTIFLTSFNLKLSFEDIYALYALRWRIETIFKAWKSNLNFANIHNVSYYQFYILIYCRFIMNQLIFTKFYKDFLESVLKKHNKIISIMALTKRLMLRLEHYLLAFINNKTEYLIDTFARFCTYEKRKRKNYYEMEQAIFESLNEFYEN